MDQSEFNARAAPSGCDPTVATQRLGFDVAQQNVRSKTDRFRLDERFIRDRTRHNGHDERGRRGAHESLERERRSEDDGLSAERASADVARREEHQLSDATLTREKDARVCAEVAARDGLDRESCRTRELVDVLKLVQAQLAVVATNLNVLLVKVPGQEFRGLLAVSLGAVGYATDRVHDLVDQVLDVRDLRPVAPDVGGDM